MRGEGVTEDKGEKIGLPWVYFVELLMMASEEVRRMD